MVVVHHVTVCCQAEKIETYFPFPKSFPGNHCIRAIDLDSREVYLLAGVPKIQSNLQFGDPEQEALAAALKKILGIKTDNFEEFDQEAKKKTFHLPISIDIRTNGSMYDIYVADSGNSCIRKLSIPKSQIAENSESRRDVPKIPTGCKPSGLAPSPDGQWAIVSCPEVGEIYKIDFDSEAAVRIAGTNSSGSENAGYSDGIGSLATFRYPRNVVMSPGGAFALIAE